MDEGKGLDKRILDEILNSIRKINYGEVVVTIHNSEVVQIERKERKRFDLRPSIPVQAGI